MNVDGMVDALQEVRRHPRIPAWDRPMRERVKALLSARVDADRMYDSLASAIAEWEMRV